MTGWRLRRDVFYCPIAVGKRFLIHLGGIFALVAVWGVITGCGTNGGAELQQVPSSKSVEVPPSKPTDVVTETVKALAARGWSDNPAKSVAEFNQRYLELAWETDRSVWEKTINLWGRLGSRPSLQRTVERNPEFVSLLAGVLELREKAGQLIAQSIPEDAENRQTILSLYGMLPEAPDAVMLAEALQRDGDLILRLCNHGLLGALDWLLHLPEDGEAAQIYRQWVREFLETALHRMATDEEAMDRALAVLDIHAPAVLELLRKEDSFRQKFLAVYWPRFCQAMGKAEQAPNPNERNVLLVHYVADPRVWQYYHLLQDQGEDTYSVFERYGHVAVDLMLASEYGEMRDKVFEVLRVADEEVLEGLAADYLRRAPLFHHLLKRKIPDWAIAKAIRELLAQPAEASKRLSYWHGLSDAALLEEIGPPVEGPQTWIPGYGLYYLGKKVTQGRDLEGFDYLWAGVDVATIALPVAKGTRLAGGLIQTGVRKGGSRLATIGAEQAMKKGGLRAFYPLAIKEAHGITRQKIASTLASQSGLSVDITDAWRWFFGRLKSVGLGRKTVKALTGMDARVFMRADRRIVFDVGELFTHDTVFREILTETAENAGFELATQTSLGQQVLQGAHKAAIQAYKEPAQQWEAWRQHLAVWWTAIHIGALDGAIKDSSSRDSSPKVFCPLNRPQPIMKGDNHGTGGGNQAKWASQGGRARSGSPDYHAGGENQTTRA